MRSTTQRRAGLRFSPRLVELLLADPADVGRVAAGLADALAGRVVVGLVEAEMLGDRLGVGPLDHDGLDRALQAAWWSWTLAPSIANPERAAVLLDQQTLFLVPILALSVGLGPLLSPSKRDFPITPSAACHSQKDRAQLIALTHQRRPRSPT